MEGRKRINLTPKKEEALCSRKKHKSHDKDEEVIFIKEVPATGESAHGLASLSIEGSAKVKVGDELTFHTGRIFYSSSDEESLVSSCSLIIITHILSNTKYFESRNSCVGKGFLIVVDKAEFVPTFHFHG